MGEIADAMLDGVLCACCGTYMDDGGDDGIPRYCSDACDPMHSSNRHRPRVPRFNRYAIKPSLIRPDQVECPTCGKRVKKVGLKHHQLDVHGDQP